VQTLYPWRATFQSMFAHDRTASQRGAGSPGLGRDPSKGTKLGRCLKDSGVGAYDWQQTLSSMLQLPVAELPILPADISASFPSRVSTPPPFCFLPLSQGLIAALRHI